MSEGQASTLNLDVVNINTIQIECIAGVALKAGPLGPGWIGKNPKPTWMAILGPKIIDLNLGTLI